MIDKFKEFAETAVQTVNGKVFAASNFSVTHTGGGCTAWERYIDDTGWRVLVTDSGGSDIEISTDYEDFWIVGIHGPEGEYSVECVEAQTAEEAVQVANKMHACVAAGDFETYKIEA